MLLTSRPYPTLKCLLSHIYSRSISPSFSLFSFDKTRPPLWYPSLTAHAFLPSTELLVRLYSSLDGIDITTPLLYNNYLTAEQGTSCDLWKRQRLWSDTHKMSMPSTSFWNNEDLLFIVAKFVSFQVVMQFAIVRNIALFLQNHALHTNMLERE